ncbi:lipopolysaccharide assembly protein LapA domain-containing protein [Hydrogenibacillus schlegelii]|uniref:DUF1049 domain-containing protein n=1 Tax=Hydrogenibacillus schlegelii TaxID=1484 RepID=A0A179IPJ3_HYDSH|nr:lipopolysaccharide assembly protein LapA domain-containing protein [Hydrogenibacillus schlegelii]MBT9282820.1 DUF1049 domain-containing protein [Hydrogenibacillus schlegelii]OAR03699.1 hypothetical protein SA87_00480 [Hydrogenibacillus schlegelii]PTQ54165.1 MAG: hypothetical protein HSCHL_0809 [Hydrogenibacillus schlegelii]
MKTQWLLFALLVFAVLVAVFALLNVEPVTIRYGFGTVQTSLVLVILLSALFGGVLVGLYGIIRQYVLERDLREARKALASLEAERDALQEELGALRARLEQKEAAERGAEASDDPEGALPRQP